MILRGLVLIFSSPGFGLIFIGEFLEALVYLLSAVLNRNNSCLFFVPSAAAARGTQYEGLHLSASSLLVLSAFDFHFSDRQQQPNNSSSLRSLILLSSGL